MKFSGYILLLIAFLPLLYLRDFTPNNELKYLSIAEEAIQNQHFFTFTNHSMMYADKPPLYFWLLIGSKLLLGHYSMLFLGLLSLVPALVILYVMNQWVRPFIDAAYRQSASLSLITSGLFAGAAIVLRMDMLMCMFIVLALYTFYKIYRNLHHKRDIYLLPLYIFLALFSKGPLGLIIPLLSIYIFLIFEKKFRQAGKYFSWKQWIFLLSLCLLWFIGVYIEGGKEYLNNLLFHQTINRAVNSFQHQQPFYYYAVSIWYSLAPWSLFYLVALAWGIYKKSVSTDLERFFLIIAASIFLILSLFSSKLSIYLLPAFPFLAYLAFLLLPRIPRKVVSFSIMLPAFFLLLSFPVLFFIADDLTFPCPLLFWIAALLLTIFSGISLLFVYQKQLLKGIDFLAGGILVALFVGSFALPQVNAYIGFGEMCRKAREIAKTHHIEKYIFYNFRSGENMDAYLGKCPLKADNSYLQTVCEKEKFILFIREKDLLKEKEIKKLTNGKESYRIGKHFLFVFY